MINETEKKTIDDTYEMLTRDIEAALSAMDMAIIKPISAPAVVATPAPVVEQEIIAPIEVKIDRRKQSYKSDDPAFPYGKKADGTARKMPGRKPKAAF